MRFHPVRRTRARRPGQAMNARTASGRLGKQGGATAVEFAFVLPLMFVLFYGALTYGLIFLMRMGLQHAAEDGARAALRYPAQSCAQVQGGPCTVDEQREHQYAARLSTAKMTAMTQARWMNLRPGADPITVTSRICHVGLDCAGSAQGTPSDCGSASCQIVVTITYDYAASPFVPQALGFGLITPERIGAQARLLLDGRALTS